jgi:phosphatidylethanolamine/phosphatidyl-N-methylethanolamine N-methyltransferase
MKRKTEEEMVFLKTMLRDYKVGAITRSSRFVVKKIMKNFDPKRHKIVLECGPGDGIVTREILKSIDQDSKVVAVEINKDFVKKLKEIKDSRLKVVLEDVEDFLAGGKMIEADIVICGIPFTLMKSEKREKIVKAVFNILKKGGYFVVYQNSTLMLPVLKKQFSLVKTTFELRNFLPYFIMRAEK